MPPRAPARWAGRRPSSRPHCATGSTDPSPTRQRVACPRYAWRDHYALLRTQLDALGRELGGSYRVLVDENQHVDREGARRAGVGFYGKNTMLITRELRLVGRPRNAGHRCRDRGDAAPRPRLRSLPTLYRCVPYRCARRSGRPRRKSLPLILDTGCRAGSRGSIVKSSAPRSTVATSARTSVLLESWSREATCRPRADRKTRSPTSPSSTGSRAMVRSSLPRSTGSMSLATIRAGYSATPFMHSATPAPATQSLSSRSGRPATTRCWPIAAVWAGSQITGALAMSLEKRSVLRSSHTSCEAQWRVLAAIAEAYRAADEVTRKRLVELAVAAVGGLERLLVDAAPAYLFDSSIST